MKYRSHWPLIKLLVVTLFCLWCIVLVSGCKTMPTVEGCERMVFATQEAREQCFDAAHEREDGINERTDILLLALNACKESGGVIMHTIRGGAKTLKRPRIGGPYTRKHLPRHARLGDFQCAYSTVGWDVE